MISIVKIKPLESTLHDLFVRDTGSILYTKNHATDEFIRMLENKLPKNRIIAINEDLVWECNGLSYQLWSDLIDEEIYDNSHLSNAKN